MSMRLSRPGHRRLAALLLCLASLVEACVPNGAAIASYCADQTASLTACFPAPTFEQACNYAKSSWGALCWYNFCDTWVSSTPAAGFTSALQAMNTACGVWESAASATGTPATVTCSPNAATDGIKLPPGITSFPAATSTSITDGYYGSGSWSNGWGPPPSSTIPPDASTTWMGNTEYIWETIFIDGYTPPPPGPPAPAPAPGPPPPPNPTQSCGCDATSSYSDGYNYANPPPGPTDPYGTDGEDSYSGSTSPPSTSLTFFPAAAPPSSASQSSTSAPSSGFIADTGSNGGYASQLKPHLLMLSGLALLGIASV